VLAVAVLTQVPAQAPPAPASREARTLALLREIPHVHGRLYSTKVARMTNEFGSELVVPRVQGCGFGWEQPFDPALARRLARKLCAIYGLEPVADEPAPLQLAATLDSLDPGKRIGLKLRGVVQRRPDSEWPSVVAEPAERDLDKREHARLREAGVRVHTADIESFWSAASRDEMTTTLAYLASVAAFLNDVTDGEDVDWSAMLPFEGRWLAVPRPGPQRGVRLSHYEGGSNVIAQREVTIALAVDPRSATVRPGVEKPVVANEGRPTVLQLFGLVALRGAVHVELWQAKPGGKPRRIAESDSCMLFAPGAFDATRPFDVRLRLQPGEYRVSTQCWISGAGKR